jgi:hypothetical protein
MVVLFLDERVCRSIFLSRTAGRADPCAEAAILCKGEAAAGGQHRHLPGRSYRESVSGFSQDVGESESLRNLSEGKD